VPPSHVPHYCRADDITFIARHFYFPPDIPHPSIPSTSSLRRQIDPLLTLLPSCHWHIRLSLVDLIDVVQTQTLSAPVLGKRSRAADDPKLTDLPWLEEVHSKIWNRKDLRPQLFRNVEVTQAHYAALQKRLKELHSDRDSPDYDGAKPDVLSVKLDFLRSLTPAEAFATTSHHDMSTTTMIRRQATRTILKLNHSSHPFSAFESVNFSAQEERAENSGGSVIVSGQPGTGEFLVSLSHRI
jgi:hypothetical protein